MIRALVKVEGVVSFNGFLVYKIQYIPNLSHTVRCCPETSYIRFMSRDRTLVPLEANEKFHLIPFVHFFVFHELSRKVISTTTNRKILIKMLSVLRKARLKDKEMRILMLYEVIPLPALPY